MSGAPLRESADVLVVEDEPKIAGLLEDYLRQAGYTTDHLADGREVVQRVRARPPRAILLDLMLPGKPGTEICREIRGFSDVPILIVTARVEEIDRLLGLELGADDYICKPFSPREVVARIRTILRRLERAASATDQTSAPIAIDEARHCARVRGEPVDVTPVEFRLLATLLSQPGRVYSRDQLMQRVYSDRRIVSDRTIDTHIKNLRRKLQRALPGEEIIHSVYGVGYKLEL